MYITIDLAVLPDLTNFEFRKNLNVFVNSHAGYHIIDSQYQLSAIKSLPSYEAVIGNTIFRIAVSYMFQSYLFLLTFYHRLLRKLKPTKCLVFRIERPILGDNPKPHKFACSGRLPSSVTEA